MSQESAKLARDLQEARRLAGEWVLLRGVRYRVSTKRITGALAGQQAVSRGTFGPLIASTTPRSFNFTPADFAPVTSAPPPEEGEEITRNNLIYVVEAVEYINMDTDTVAIICNNLRKIWQIAP